MEKKLLILILSIIISGVALTGCTTEPSVGKSSDSTENKDGGEKTIALFMTHMSNEFTITLSGSVEEQVKARGYNYNVYDAAQDAARQADQIEQAVALGVKGIIIEPVSVDGIVPSVKLAKEAGVFVVIVNQRISEPEAADCYVGADAATTGKLLMEKVMQDIDSKGNIAELLGPMGSDGQVGRSKGFDSITDANPGVSVVFSDSAEWQTEKALSIVENWLNAGKNLVAIVSQNDAMAIGAAKAIEDAQLKGQVLVYGVDATSEGLQAVLNGSMTATISQGTQDQGRLAADACADLLEGKEVKAETIVENVIYTKENAQEALDELKK